MGLEYVPYAESSGYFCGSIKQGEEQLPVWLVSKFDDKWIVSTSDGTRIFRVKLKYEEVEEIHDIQ
jgi:hypothetical protein